MASAITPEPTVAIVAFARGDIGRSIAALGGVLGSGQPAHAARATPVRKNRPVLVTMADSNPARASAASRSAGA